MLAKNSDLARLADSAASLAWLRISSSCLRVVMSLTMPTACQRWRRKTDDNEISIGNDCPPFLTPTNSKVLPMALPLPVFCHLGKASQCACINLAGAISSCRFWPMASALVKPNMVSAPLFQNEIFPSLSLITMALLVDVVMAFKVLFCASKSSWACLRSVMSWNVTTAPESLLSSKIGAARNSTGKLLPSLRCKVESSPQCVCPSCKTFWIIPNSSDAALSLRFSAIEASKYCPSNSSSV